MLNQTNLRNKQTNQTYTNSTNISNHTMFTNKQITHSSMSKEHIRQQTNRTYQTTETPTYQTTKNGKHITPHNTGNKHGSNHIKLTNISRNLAKNNKHIETRRNYANIIKLGHRTILIFNILRTIHLCIRGSRTPFRNKNILDDFRLNNHEANIL